MYIFLNLMKIDFYGCQTDLINDMKSNYFNLDTLCVKHVKLNKYQKMLNVLINITKFIPRQDLNPPSPMRPFTICRCIQRLNSSYIYRLRL